MKYTGSHKYSISAILLILSLILCLPVPQSALEGYAFSERIEAGPFEEIQLEGMLWLQKAALLFDKVNELRAGLGLALLEYDAKLEELAMQRAAESSLFWAEIRPDGSRMSDLSGVDAENLDAGNSDPEAIFRNWLRSPSRYKQMTDPDFRSMGIAAYGSSYGEEPRWWAQLYSREESSGLRSGGEESRMAGFRVRVNPTLLQLRILTGAQLLTGMSNEDFSTRSVIRIQPGETVRVLGLIHYLLEDEYACPGSIPAAGLVWSNSSPETVKMNADGTLVAQNPGTSLISVEMSGKPELRAEVEVQVVPVRTFSLNASLMPSETEELYRALSESYAALPSVDTCEGERTPMASREMEKHYRFYDELQRDSMLQLFAKEMSKQLSLCSFPDAHDSLPDLRKIVERYAPGRISWHGFSDADAPEEQIIDIPGWAKSAGAMILNSGGRRHTFVVFSEREGDQRFLSPTELLSGEKSDPKNELGMIYDVRVFYDRADFRLAFFEEDKEIESLELDDPSDPRLEILEDGSYLYRPELLLKYNGENTYAAAEPAHPAIFYEFDAAEKIAITDDGSFHLLSAGTVTVSVHYVDLVTTELIAGTQLLVNNKLPYPQTGGPEGSDPPQPDEETREEAASP